MRRAVRRRTRRRRLSRYPVVLYACILSPAVAAAQEAPLSGSLTALASGFVSERWGVEHGLPANEITGIAQTPDGYLWLSTFDGVARFDGVRFRVYRTGNAPGLPTNRISAIHATADGTLWLLTETQELVRYRDGEFQALGEEHGVRGRIQDWFEDSEGVLWLATSRDVARIADGRAEPLEDVELGLLVSAIFREDDGTLWLGTERGVQRHRAGRVATIGAGSRVLSARIYEFFRDAGDTLWVSSTAGVERIYGDEPIPFGAPDGRSLGQARFVADAGGRLAAIGAEGGVFVRDGDAWHERKWPRAGATILPAAFVVDEQGVLWGGVGGRVWRGDRHVLDTGGLQVRDFLLDGDGSLWIAGLGLYRLKSALLRQLGEPEGYGVNFYTIHQDPDGTLWLGSIGYGLTRVADGIPTRLGEEAGIPGSVRSIERTHRDSLWIGSTQGVCVFDGAMCRSPFESGARPVSGDVRAIHLDEEGALWFGTSTGLYRRDPRGSWRHLTEADGLPATSVRLVRPALGGGLWIGTYGGGVARIRGGEVEVLDAEAGLSSNLTRALHEDEDGTLWVGTEGHGLNRVSFLGPDFTDVEVTTYREKDGLFDDVIHTILDDRRGRLWMNTNQGIFWVARSGLEAFAAGRATRIYSTYYGERDGLRNREGNGGVESAGLLAADGHLWFPMLAGVAVFDPSQVGGAMPPPVVMVEEIAVAGDTVEVRSDRVELPRSVRSVDIRYTGLRSARPANIRFRYRLEDLDADWIAAGTRRVAFYTNLPPGSHTLHVQASHDGGTWSPQPAALTIRVPPYLHETALFRWAMVASAILVGLYWLRAREARVRGRERDLRELVAARTSDLVLEKEGTERARREAERNRRLAETALEKVRSQAEHMHALGEQKSRFFANVSHEFRTPLTLTIGPLEDLLEADEGIGPDARPRLRLALRNARRLLRLVNQVLDVSRLESGVAELSPRHGDLAAFAREIALAFAPLAERRRVAFVIELPEEPVSGAFDPDVVEKILGNLLSNAFKFTPTSGEVRFAFRDAGGGRMEFEISDTGPGIRAGELERVFERFYRGDDGGARSVGSGIGLALARDLAALHGGGVEVRSEVGLGTTFTAWISLPVPASDPEADVAGEPRPPRLWASEDELADEGAVARPATGGRTEDVPAALVVDDNPDIHQYLAGILGGRFRLLHALGTSEAIALAREDRPDVVISDVAMPGRDGIALCRTLRHDRTLGDVPILILTAQVDRDRKLEALDAGADAFLVKPFDADELEAILLNLVDGRRRLKSRALAAAVLRPDEVDVDSRDARFLRRVREVIEREMGDETFEVDRLASELAMSRSALYRRLRGLGDESAAGIIRRMRLDRAAQLIESGAGSIAAVGFMVGFKSVSHFSKAFKERFGVPPSRYPEADSDPADA